MVQSDSVYVWRWKKQHPTRFGETCRIVGSDATVTDLVTVEFADGVQIVAPRTAVRRYKTEISPLLAKDR